MFSSDGELTENLPDPPAIGSASAQTGEVPVLLETVLPLPVFIRGKVRDTYDLGNQLLIVATDRISAFDVVLPTGIPYKGMVLNQLSVFWFRRTSTLVPNHLLELLDEVHCLDSYIPEEEQFHCPGNLVGRSMIVKKVKRIPVECVIRGYLAGSAWAEYQKSGTVAGKPMPRGMQESQELRQPMFTPTTKADTGHDLPMDMDSLVKMVGRDRADELEQKSLLIYEHAREYARSRGIIIADTKMEFGLDGERLILIDELLTPDSSRLWDADLYRPGQPQPSLDKQPVRDWLTGTGWQMGQPPPAMPPEIVHATAERYLQAYQRLTGRRLSGLT
ncbi:MAG: phosphoribosylaminoimidazolesuccinocarboxamide synthase [Chloroflexi bacterium]|nr:phosphoribosylaminoimidazolesuccinocarboxamide synthase [Chloroflexota bacterium]